MFEIILLCNNWNVWIVIRVNQTRTGLPLDQVCGKVDHLSLTEEEVKLDPGFPTGWGRLILMSHTDPLHSKVFPFVGYTWCWDICAWLHEKSVNKQI